MNHPSSKPESISLKDFRYDPLSSFAGLKPDPDKLTSFGFERQSDGSFLLPVSLIENELEARLFIHADSTLSFCVVDLDTQEDYLPFYRLAASGPYVSKARESWQKIAEKLKESIFLSASRQQQLLFDWVMQTYEEKPDYPFEEPLPVLRHTNNQKWYAIFLQAEKDKLAKKPAKKKTSKKTKGTDHKPACKADSSADPGTERPASKSEASSTASITAQDDASSTERLTVLNVKTTPGFSPDPKRGIYPAYHMSHTHWISIVLDDKLNDHELIQALEQSRQAVCPKSAWIVPANPSFFDLTTMFDKSPTHIWTQRAHIYPGDLVYLYAGMPIGEILYQTEVIKSGIPYKYEDENLKLEKVMELKLIQRLPKGLLTRSWLQDHGIQSIRSARRIPDKTVQEMQVLIEGDHP